MTDLNTKYKLLYLPFLYCFIGMVIGYTLLHWCCIVSYDMLSVSETMVNFGIPLVIAILLVAFVLRPTILLLEFKKNNGAFSLYFIAVLALTIPTLLTQQYLDTATGVLTPLQRISQYESAPKSKYYTVSQSYIGRSFAGCTRRRYTTGKHNTTLHFKKYYALPVFDRAEDTLRHSCHYWLCTNYSHSMSNSSSSEEKAAAQEYFENSSRREFNSLPIYKANYWERVGIVNVTDWYERAVNHSVLERDGASVLFEPHFDSFEERNGNGLGNMVLGIGIALVAYGGLLMMYRLKKEG
jgi:rhomboid protease GluP